MALAPTCLKGYFHYWSNLNSSLVIL